MALFFHDASQHLSFQTVSICSLILTYNFNEPQIFLLGEKASNSGRTWDAIDSRTTTDVLDVKSSNKNSRCSPCDNSDRMTLTKGKNSQITSFSWISRSVSCFCPQIALEQDLIIIIFMHRHSLMCFYFLLDQVFVTLSSNEKFSSVSETVYPQFLTHVVAAYQ